jgi:hypothetical protein
MSPVTGKGVSETKAARDLVEAQESSWRAFFLRAHNLLKSVLVAERYQPLR